MRMNRRWAFGLGLGVALAIAVAAGLWWQSRPSTEQVQRTVITTIQEEASASFLVTGTLEVNVTVELDSSQYLTPDWLTYVVSGTQPEVLPLLRGTSSIRVQVPGRVSYGIEVEALTPNMISVEPDGVVAVDLPELAVHSVETDLDRLRVKTRTEGWMRILPSDVHEDVRTSALKRVQEAFRAQAHQHLASATQPRINTARALETTLAPPLEAAGIESPRFRIRVGDRLSLTPDEKPPQNFQK